MGCRWKIGAQCKYFWCRRIVVSKAGGHTLHRSNVVFPDLRSFGFDVQDDRVEAFVSPALDEQCERKAGCREAVSQIPRFGSSEPLVGWQPPWDRRQPAGSVENR